MTDIEMVEHNTEKRTYLDCLLMITEAAIDYVSETQSPFEYDDMAYWLGQHNELCHKLYGVSII